MKAYQPTGDLFQNCSILEIHLHQIGIYSKQHLFTFEVYSPPQFFYQGQVLVTQDKLYIMIPFVMTTQTFIKYSYEDKKGFSYLSQIIPFAITCDKQDLQPSHHSDYLLGDMFERISHKIMERDREDEQLQFRSTLLTDLCPPMEEPVFDLQSEISNIQPQPL